MLFPLGGVITTASGVSQASFFRGSNSNEAMLGTTKNIGAVLKPACVLSLLDGGNLFVSG